MHQLKNSLVALIAFLTFGLPALATAAAEDYNPKEVPILDKLSDHYYLDLKPAGKVELPRIFIDEDGVSFFLNTTAAINSGKYVDRYYAENNLPA
ncbi:MAG: hypothetical protein LAT57_00365 [Balneolales bacterium]|nr:hypothetical protein [Balneolales bacterium]